MKTKKEEKLEIRRIENGFLVGVPQSYDAPKDASFCLTFEDAVLNVAQRMGEVAFAATIKQANAMATAISEVAAIAVAPRLLAIDARINPGSENVVDKKVEFEDHISF